MIFRGRYFDRCCGGWHCDGLAGTFVPAAETGNCHDAFLGLLPFYLFLCAGKDQGCHGLHTESGRPDPCGCPVYGRDLKNDRHYLLFQNLHLPSAKMQGYASIAGQIQVLAKLSILALGMPVLMAFLSTVEAFL